MLSQRLDLPKLGSTPPGPAGSTPGKGGLLRGRLGGRAPAFGVLLLGVASTAALSGQFQAEAHRAARDRFNLVQVEMAHDTRDRLRFYENVLRAASGLFGTMANVTQDEWRAYVRGLQIDRSYPGIQGLGYAIQLAATEPRRPELPSAERAVVYPQFSVFPGGTRPAAATLLPLERPAPASSAPAFGFDMFSEPACADAMARARDTGMVAMTSKVELIDDAESGTHSGFFIFLPVYARDSSHETPEQRQAAIAGYFYAPVRAAEFLAAISRDRAAGIATEVFDGPDVDPARRMHASPPDQPVAARLQSTVSLEVLGRIWSLRFRSLPAFEDTVDGSKTRWGLAIGLLCTGLLFAVVLQQSMTRRRALALAERMTFAARVSEARVRETAAAMTVARDVAIEASRAKTDFLATMSHEIRTPLNGVLGISELLLDTPLSDEQRQLVQSLKDCGQALLGLVNDVLDLSKIEAGKMEIAHVALDLRGVVRSALSVSKARARQKSLTMTGAMDDDVPAKVLGDPQRLEQVLLNLISNAVKFTEEGSVAVRIRREAGATSRPPFPIRFEVTDTGPGISTAAQSRLFEPFLQVDASSTRKHGGTGLGLAISKRLVKAMGGHIGVDSAPGKGSQFWFTLRFEEASAPSASAEAEAEPAPAQLSGTASSPPVAIEARTVGRAATSEDRGPRAGSLRDDGPQIESESRPRILLAEDNAVNRTVAIAMLKKYRVTIDVVVNGRQALEASGRGDYGLILMDCQMPEMDGLEATALIRQSEGRGAPRTPIVALTANALAEDRERCMTAGMDDYLSKPLTRAALEAMLRRWVPQIREADLASA